MSLEKGGETSEYALDYLFGELLRYPRLSEDPEAIQDTFEGMGISIGGRLIERLMLRHSFSGTEPLDKVKFLCKEFWESMFQKKMGTPIHEHPLVTLPCPLDKLQTNHKGVFVLSESKFRLMNRFISSEPGVVVLIDRLMLLTCGAIKGALEGLGMPGVVTADAKAFPAITFHIKAIQ